MTFLRKGSEAINDLTTTYADLSEAADAISTGNNRRWWQRVLFGLCLGDPGSRPRMMAAPTVPKQGAPLQPEPR